MKTFSDGHAQSADERERDLATVRMLDAHNERRARPRCTHRPEDIMRLGDGSCPACSPAEFCADDNSDATGVR